MTDLDETDVEILRLLVADGRRPYSDIAESVDLSAPAVRDRIDRLREAGVIRRFTVDVDRSALREGIPVLIDLSLAPGALEGTRAALAGADGVEHLFTTADARLVVGARVPDGDVRAYLEGAIDLEAVRGYEVSLLADVEWTPAIQGTTLALECAECGNTVTAEGESRLIDDTRYHFCCPSCASRFAERFADIEEGA